MQKLYRQLFSIILTFTLLLNGGGNLFAQLNQEETKNNSNIESTSDSPEEAISTDELNQSHARHWMTYVLKKKEKTPEDIIYKLKMLNPMAPYDGLNHDVHHIRFFGGLDLDEGIPFHSRIKSGLEQTYLGAIYKSDPSIDLKTFKEEINKLAGPNGFKEPPLIDLTTHGYLFENPKKGKPTWHGKFTSGPDNIISEIIDLFNDGRNYNLYFRTCRAGALMNDFLALPLEKRERLNIFVETAPNQRAVALVEPQNSTSALEAAIDSIFNSVEYSNIGVRAIINGKHYYPLEAAINKAIEEGNIFLAKKLSIYKVLLETADTTQFKEFALKYGKLFPNIPLPIESGFTITTKRNNISGNVLYIDEETMKYVLQVTKDMFCKFKDNTKPRLTLLQKANPMNLTFLQLMGCQ